MRSVTSAEKLRVQSVVIAHLVQMGNEKEILAQSPAQTIYDLMAIHNVEQVTMTMKRNSDKSDIYVTKNKLLSESNETYSIPPAELMEIQNFVTNYLKNMKDSEGFIALQSQLIYKLMKKLNLETTSVKDYPNQSIEITRCRLFGRDANQSFSDHQDNVSKLSSPSLD